MSKFIGLKDIPIDQIDPDPNQPRKIFDEDGIKELGYNMLEKGQTTPICLVPKDGRYKLVYGERRTRGAKVIGMKTLRAEVWELNDIEAGLFQARELLNTVIARGEGGTPAEDSFLVDLFHRIVEDRITCSMIEHVKFCPHCYQCPKSKIRKDENPCPAFFSLKDFAEKIGQDGEAPGKHKTSISYAFQRAGLREEVPELKKMEDLKPTQVNVIASLHKKVGLMKDKKAVKALAKKTAGKKLGTTCPSKKSGKTKLGPTHTLEQISGRLRDKSVPGDIKKKLIYKQGYGPGEADLEILEKKAKEQKKEVTYDVNVEKILEKWREAWNFTDTFNVEPFSPAAKFRLAEGLGLYYINIQSFIEKKLLQPGKTIDELAAAINQRLLQLKGGN